MLSDKTVAVVVPAYNEALQIGLVIENMPDFVDRIVIVNDCSKDATSEAVRKYIDKGCQSEVKLTSVLDEEPDSSLYNRAELILRDMDIEEKQWFTRSEVYNPGPAEDRIILIDHLENGGVGAAIATGYKWCKDHRIDCTAVMAGDGQMDPAELHSICAPVVEENLDYVKGNRLIHRSAWKMIPRVRFFGNSILSILTKVASGYWHVSDTQTGYTAISLRALNAIRIYDIYKSYGMPNDMLVKLNIAFCTMREVEIKPVYNVGEQSKMKIMKVIPRVSWLLIKSFFKRLWNKYLFRDFHPLFLLYNFSFLLGLYNIKYLVQIIEAWLTPGIPASDSTLIKFIFLFIASFQSLFFAMWMDIQDNERLNR